MFLCRQALISPKSAAQRDLAKKLRALFGSRAKASHAAQCIFTYTAGHFGRVTFGRLVVPRIDGTMPFFTAAEAGCGTVHPPVLRPLPDALLCTCLYKFFLPATRPGHVTVPCRTWNRSKGGFFVAAKPHASLPNPHERTPVQRQHLCESNCYFHHAAGTGM